MHLSRSVQPREHTGGRHRPSGGTLRDIRSCSPAGRPPTAYAAVGPGLAAARAPPPAAREPMRGAAGWRPGGGGVREAAQSAGICRSTAPCSTCSPEGEYPRAGRPGPAGLCSGTRSRGNPRLPWARGLAGPAGRLPLPGRRGPHGYSAFSPGSSEPVLCSRLLPGRGVPSGCRRGLRAACAPLRSEA